MADESTEVNRPRELHRRTWELELLISGAIVVALLKMPAAVDAVYEQLAPHVSRDLHNLVWFIYSPTKFVLTPAVIIFAVHVLLRGLWVGLVGLNAVFPDGVQWDRLDLGPVQRRFLSERVFPDRFQDQVDRIASTLFSVLFSILALTVSLGFWFAVAMGAALALRGFGSDVSIGKLAFGAYITMFALIFVPALFSFVLDRFLARSDRETGFVAWLSRGTYAVFWYMTLGFLWYPASGVLLSNLSRRKIPWWKSMMFSVPIGLLLAFIVLAPLLGPRIVESLDSYVWSPDDPAAEGMFRRHYDTLRTGEGPLRAPSIPTDVPEGSWLRLYLPYRATTDNPRLAEVCPDSEPFRADGDPIAALIGRSGTPAERQAVLACFARLWTIELDGASVSSPEMLFADGPDGRSRGVVTYLDLRDLAPGRHDLSVGRRPTEEERGDSDFDPEDYRFHIPFWR